jgi:hypothetical protein
MHHNITGLLQFLSFYYFQFNALYYTGAMHLCWSNLEAHLQYVRKFYNQVSETPLSIKNSMQ